jgi:hypothetical protein
MDDHLESEAIEVAENLNMLQKDASQPEIDQ